MLIYIRRPVLKEGVITKHRYDYRFEYTTNGQIEIDNPFSKEIWQDAIVTNSIANRMIYGLSIAIIPNNCVNSITDYKGVWGLNNLEKGDYSSRIQLKECVLYWGIKQVEQIAFAKCSPIVILSYNKPDYWFLEKEINAMVNQPFDLSSLAIAAAKATKALVFSYEVTDVIEVNEYFWGSQPNSTIHLTEYPR